MRCILIGTGSLAVPVAGVLHRTPVCDFLGVITKPDERSGRRHALTPPPLAAWSRIQHVHLWQPETKTALTEVLRTIGPDVAVVVAYGKIIPPEALAIPPLGCINLHPSLLPKHRGPSPIQTAIANGDTDTGVTLMLLDAEVDHGPILAQERIALSPTATHSTLERELGDHGATLLERTLPDYLAGRITPQPQDHTHATTTPLLSREDGRLDWTKPAVELERRVRAYEGWPGTWCTLPDGTRLKMLTASVGGTTDATPGTIVRARDQFAVACGGGSLLMLVNVQPEGKPPMGGEAFLRGHHTLAFLR